MMEIPKEAKVLTTTYESFGGVDFTNDPSNVWRRRSPDGVNMLPDESGRPFKRTGWEKVIKAEDIIGLYTDDNPTAPVPLEVTIRKCYYFELAGVDHIVIFTNIGVFMYREVTADSHDGELISFSDSYEQDLIESWERSFFFEGNGRAAFYSYGGYRVWNYYYDNGFAWTEATPYVPRVNIAVDSRHISGTDFEAVNMLSKYISEEFQDNLFMSITSSTTDISGATVTVNEDQFCAMVNNKADTYVFTYTLSSDSWAIDGKTAFLPNYGITLNTTGAIPNGSKVTVVLDTTYRVNLPSRVDDADEVEVLVSVGTQFDTPLTVQDSEDEQTTYYCTLVVPMGTGNSHLKFYHPWTPLIDGEDAIRVTIPRDSLSGTTQTITQTVNVGV